MTTATPTARLLARTGLGTATSRPFAPIAPWSLRRAWYNVPRPLGAPALTAVVGGLAMSTWSIVPWKTCGRYVCDMLWIWNFCDATVLDVAPMCACNGWERGERTRTPPCENRSCRTRRSSASAMRAPQACRVTCTHRPCNGQHSPPVLSSVLVDVSDRA